MNRGLQLLLIAIIMAVLAATLVPNLGAMFGTDPAMALCSKPLPISVRKIDCNSSALIALFENTLEAAEDNRMRVTVLVIRKPRVSPRAETLKHYVIVDVDCSTMSESDVLLVRTFDISNIEQGSPTFFEDFLDYWFSPEPAKFHSTINKVACARI